MRFIRIFFCILFIASSPDVRGASLSALLENIKTEFFLTVIYDSVQSAVWKEVLYEKCDDSSEVHVYLKLLYKEYSKYPAGYFRRAGVNRIALGKKLRFGEQHRAAVPDPYTNTLFFSIDGHNGVSSEVYLVHVLHHELNHCREYAAWKDMRYKWTKWRKLNERRFRYGEGGETAYENPAIDWYAMTHPRKGFVNLYSTTAQEEDRSEIIALIMSDEERKFLFEYSAKDKVLRKKIRITLRLLDQFCETKENYWQKCMKKEKSK